MVAARLARDGGAPSQDQPPPGEDLITVNFGPNHPSTHGVLRLIVTLDGEVVVGLDADIGYVHTGFEKNFEQKTYWKGIPYGPRKTTSASSPTSWPTCMLSRS